MPLKNKIIDALNEIRASEQRMALVYRRAAQMVTGPWREALVKELKEHADDEDTHAEIAIRHIVALGGDPTEEIKEIPVWHNLDELLSGLDDLEEKGIRKWQSLMKLLDTDDAFRHTIEEVLSTEQSHYDEVKQWRRKDYADMGKSINDLGSPKPLNWKTPEFTSQETRKSSWSERIEQHNRFGTPPTRRAHSGLEPACPPEMNPPLTVGKALLAPPKVEAGQVKPQKPRKRSPDGKFSTNQSAGKQSAAQEDSTDRQRQAKLNAARQKMALNPEWAGKTRLGMTKKGAMGGGVTPEESMPPLDPAKSPGDPMAGEQTAMQEEQAMGRAPSGVPIYDDPYHPEHEGMTPEDHNAAAEMFDRKAVEAQERGNHVESIMCQQKASIHRNMAADSQLPMERMVQNLAGPQSAPPPSSQQQGFGKALPGAGDEMNPMDKFLSTQHQEDQGKPIFGDRYSPGPQPGKIDNRTQSPIGPQTPEMGHAGTFPQPQMMPPPPPAMNGSMPEIGGNQGTVVGQPPMGMDPMMPPGPEAGGMGGMPGMMPPNPMMASPMANPMFNTSLLDQLLQKPAPPQPMMQPQMQAQQSQAEPQMQQGGGIPPQQEMPGSPGLNEYGEEPQEEDEPASTAPFGGDGKEEKANQDSKDNATKSLRSWLKKYR